MNQFNFITLATALFTYFLALNSYTGAAFELRIDGATNYTGNVVASGVGTSNGTASGSGPNSTATLTVSSVGSASGVTFETGHGNVVSVGTGVSGTGSGSGSGSAAGNNATVGIITSGAGNGTAGHTGTTNSSATAGTPPSRIASLSAGNRKGRTFFIMPSYGGYYGGYNPYYRPRYWFKK